MEAEVRYWKSTSKFLNSESHIDEQSIWRLSEVKEKSPKCIEAEHCIQCGCSILEKSFETKGCDEGCYPELMDKDKWNDFKEKNNLQIS